jgi:hypothetical protein
LYFEASSDCGETKPGKNWSNKCIKSSTNTY